MAAAAAVVPTPSHRRGVPWRHVEMVSGAATTTAEEADSRRGLDLCRDPCRGRGHGHGLGRGLADFDSSSRHRLSPPVHASGTDRGRGCGRAGSRDFLSDCLFFWSGGGSRCSYLWCFLRRGHGSRGDRDRGHDRGPGPGPCPGRGAVGGALGASVSGGSVPWAGGLRWIVVVCGGLWCVVMW